MESKNCLYMYSCKRLPQHENVVDVLTLISKKSKFAATASVIGDVAIIAGGTMLVYYWQIQTATAPGRGIVMSILDDGTTATLIIGYSPQ